MLRICVRSVIHRPEWKLTDSLEIQLPQITSEDFSRLWTHSELVTSAKEWNAAKQLMVVPTLLWWKLIDYCFNLSEDKRNDVKTLKTAL